jgi:hypothetical protein
MNFISGKYIFIAHGKQITVEKYDYNFNFESLSFFVPSGYVLENPRNVFASSSKPDIPEILCQNRLNLDIISKIPINNSIKLRKMIFTVSDKDLLEGNEVFYINAGLYYCESNKSPKKILHWEDLKKLDMIGFKTLFNIINNNAIENGINPRTTAVYLYSCRSSCVEPKRGYIRPRVLPTRGREKLIGIGGPSINQRTGNLMITPYIENESTSASEISSTSNTIGGNGIISNNERVINVDENIFYQYNSEDNIIGGREKIRKYKRTKLYKTNKLNKKLIIKNSYKKSKTKQKLKQKLKQKNKFNTRKTNKINKKIKYYKR